MLVNVDRYNALRWLAVHGGGGDGLPVWFSVARKLPEFEHAPAAWAAYTLWLGCVDEMLFHAFTGCTDYALRQIVMGQAHPTPARLGWFALGAARCGASHHAKLFGELWARCAVQGGAEHATELAWAYVVHMAVYPVTAVSEASESDAVVSAAGYVTAELAAHLMRLGPIGAPLAEQIRGLEVTALPLLHAMLVHRVRAARAVRKPLVTGIDATGMVCDGGAVDMAALVDVLLYHPPDGGAVNAYGLRWTGVAKRGRPPGARNRNVTKMPVRDSGGVG